MRRKCEASVLVAASPETIWVVVSDVTRVGQWSGECRGCTWLGDARAVVPGARFKGRNRRGGTGWTRLNEVVKADRARELVWRTVPSGPYPDSVEWHLSLAEQETGTRVTGSFEVVKMPHLMEWSRSRSRCRRTEIAPAI